MPGSWLPDDFQHPLHVTWTKDVHLRPITAADVDIDLPVVTSNRGMLWRMYGEAWGWPPETLSREADAEDLQHHADDMEAHASFNYAILPTDESTLYGCLYIDPADSSDVPDADPRREAEVSWWLSADAPAPLHADIDAFALAWLRSAWPFTRLHTPFNDVSADG